MSSSSSASSIVQQLRKEKNLGSSARIGWDRLSIGFDKEQAYLELMLRNSVIGDVETGNRRSTSVIIYGVPGSGKTTLVESALAKLDKEDDAFHKAKLVVRLSGLLCPDFKSSIEEICWQLTLDDPFKDDDALGEEEDVEDGRGEVTRAGEDLTCFEELANANNFDDRLEQVMEFLKTNMESLNKSIIFILDKLDRFAEHPNQHLLYNLYDLAANSKSTIPICIIGVTDRVDVLELFEKRVKSRFSHRNINLCPRYDFDAYLQIAQRLISFSEGPTAEEDNSNKDAVLNNSILNRHQKRWNKDVDVLLKNVDAQRTLRMVFDTDPTILKLSSYLFTVLILTKDTLSIVQFNEALEQCVCKYDPVKVVLDLPITDVVVLLSIYKQIQSKKLQAWQPASLYKIVEKIMASFSLGKEDYLKAITKLEILQLIVPVSNSQRNVGGVNNAGEIYYKCELTFTEFQDIWKTYPQLPSSFKELL